MHTKEQDTEILKLSEQIRLFDILQKEKDNILTSFNKLEKHCNLVDD
jgi:hypothetical protein